MRALLLTIVTPSLNRRKTIARALDSVAAQDYAPIEHIVVDGGSTDGTHELLTTRPAIRVIAEPDRNLYDALNKGIAAARGDVVCLLNTDDWFAPGAFGAATAAFAADPELEMASGGVDVVDLAIGRTVARLNDPAMKRLRLRDVISGIPAMNGRFFRRSLLGRVGLFDIRFPIAADRDFLLRVLLAGVRNQVLPGVTYCYGSHPGSLSLAGRSARKTLAAEYLRLAQLRWRESGNDRAARAAYGRWRDWAAGYQAATLLAGGELGAAVALAARTVTEAPAWPLSFLAQAIGHWRERDARR